MRARIFCFGLLTTLTGCITMGSEPVSVGPDTYQLSMTGSGFATQGNTSMKALKAANVFCARSGLHLLPRHQDESGVYGFSPRQNTLVFMCLKDTDPRYRAGNWRKDNGVTTIENR